MSRKLEYIVVNGPVSKILGNMWWSGSTYFKYKYFPILGYNKYTNRYDI